MKPRERSNGKRARLLRKSQGEKGFQCCGDDFDRKRILLRGGSQANRVLALPTKSQQKKNGLFCLKRLEDSGFSAAGEISKKNGLFLGELQEEKGVQSFNAAESA